MKSTSISALTTHSSQFGGNYNRLLLLQILDTKNLMDVTNW